MKETYIYKTECASFNRSNISDELMRLGITDEFLRDVAHHTTITDFKRELAIARFKYSVGLTVSFSFDVKD